MEPFVDLIRLLQPRAMLWGGIRGAGRWALSFRPRKDLLFCWLEEGACQLIRPHLPAVHLRCHDFLLIRSTAPFVLGTDRTVEPVDSETLAAATRRTRFKLGTGTRSRVTLKGGRFVFHPENEALLLRMVPVMVHVAADDTSSWRVRSLLQMAEAESRQPGFGGEFIIKHLMELLLVEILRGESRRIGEQQPGLLAGLADQVIGRALTLMHKDVAFDWTVASLAKQCGVSRSGFAVRFRQVVGSGPIHYLQRWRMAVAKAELRRGAKSIGELALAVGFQSVSAFSTAFTREVGCSPKRFVAEVRFEDVAKPKGRPKHLSTPS